LRVGKEAMIARRDLPLWWMLARFKLRLWRYLAKRALCRGIRRAVDWLVPAG
jgi:hypothetical protein